MSKITILLALVAALASSALAAVVVEPYYAYRLSQRLGLTSVGYATQVHADITRHLNAEKLAQGTPVALMFYGDSTMEGLDVRAFGTGAVNHGIGGLTLGDVRADWEATSGVRAGRDVVLLAGFNDLARGRTVAESAADLAAMLAMRQPGEATLVIGVLPTNPKGRLGRLVDNPSIMALNAALEAQCAEAMGCAFADPAKAPFAFEAPLAAQFDAGDGVHLSAEGYRHLARFIAKRLDRPDDAAGGQDGTGP
ncbi:MAG: SGNH/GDSL hydrolase family protein [Pseudomonadota bacterium]